MNQYLKIQYPPGDLAFTFRSRHHFHLLILTYVLIFIFSIYATLFLAVTVPFLPRHSPLVYVSGILITLRYALCIYNCIMHGIRYGSGMIRFASGMFILEGDKQRDSMAYDDIQYGEQRVDGQFVLHGLYSTIEFPVMLLSENARLHFYSYLSDMTPGRSSLLHQLGEVAEAVVLALLLAVHIIWYVAQNYYIPTGSMRETLVEKDHIFGEKLSLGIRIPQMLGMKDEVLLRQFSFRSFKRGDIVVSKPPNSDEEREFIKRIIALPGESFSIHGGYVYIDNERLDEPYTKGATRYHGDDSVSIEGLVPRDSVVVLGDNRLDSLDSRVFGYVPLSHIRSRAFFLYFNIDEFKKLDFSRFGFIW